MATDTKHSCSDEATRLDTEYGTLSNASHPNHAGPKLQVAERWSIREKMRLLLEAKISGLDTVARRHGVNRQQISLWQRQLNNLGDKGMTSNDGDRRLQTAEPEEDQESNVALSTEVPIAPTKTRRRWSKEQKRTLIAEAETNGFSATARRTGVSRQMLYLWRRQLRQISSLDAQEIEIKEPAAAEGLHHPQQQEHLEVTGAVPSAQETCWIEVMVADSWTLRTPMHIEPALLQRLVTALQGANRN